jgi:signal transduction histidine kinase/ligand-binding sensor domain-containing protein
MRLSSLTIVVILALGTRAWTADRLLEANQHAHLSWTLRSGTLKGYPKSLAQTADGYLWLGTDFGVVRFDGVQFVPWNPSDGLLPATTIVKLLGTRDGSLWIGTVKGLARWKDRVLTRFPELEGRYVTALVEGRDGAVWVGTNAGVTSGEAARLCTITASSTKCQTEESLGRFVISLYRDARDVLWVGSATGLWRWQPGERTQHRLPALFPEITSIGEDGDGAIIVAANREIRRLHGQAFANLELPGAVRPLKATALWRDQTGGLWIGTQDQGLIHVRGERVDRFRHGDGLSGDFVNSIFEDAEGNIWVATLTGLDRFRPIVVASMSTRQGLSADTVLSVLATRDSSVWLGTVAGLNRWKDGQVTRHAIPDAPPREGVASLFEDSVGRVWVSSPRGLVYFERGGSTAVKVAPKGYVYDMTEDRAGNLWVSDQEHGLLRIRGGRHVETLAWRTLGNGPARALATDPDDGLWLGFDDGIAHFADGRVRARYSTAEGIAKGPVRHLRFAADGSLWAATDDGLSRVQQGRPIVTLRAANGLPCDGVRWSIEDNAGAVWIHTTCALVRVPRGDFDAFLADPRRVLRPTVYDSSDGVPAHPNVSSYRPTVTKATDGRIWFASYEGAAVIDPQRLPFNRVVPQVHIEQITADGNVRNPSTVSRLPPSVRDVRIDYTAASFTTPAKVRFRYRLEGRDREWVDAGNRRQAFYTDLAPGTYSFHVVAANNDGIWSERAAVWRVVVEPRLHQTTTFRAIAAAAILLAGWTLYRIRVTRLAAQMNVRFEERLAERTRIAQELHDTVLQNVLSASMQLHVISRQVDDHQVRGRLEQVFERLRQVNGEGRQTLEGLRAQHGIDDDLGLALARDAEDLRGQELIDIKLVVEGKRQPLHPLIGDDLYRIGREALVNAFRHASPKHVEIQLDYTTDHLRVCVRDDGTGIQSKVLETGQKGHWGIVGMRERAERVGATLRVMSAPGAGTELEFVVPGRVAFQRPVSRRARWWRRVAADLSMHANSRT